MNIERLIAMVLLVSVISACQSTPHSPAPEAELTRAIDISEQDIGQDFIWGGEILEITNLKNTTEITVLGYPLDKHHKPKYKGSSSGRFIAVYPGFLEPIDYKKGRLISVSGTLKNIRTGNVASADYEFPVIEIDDLNVHKRKPNGLNLPFSIGIGIGIHN